MHRDRETERQRDREAERQRDRETERQRGREAERQRHRQTHRNTDTRTDTDTRTRTCTHILSRSESCQELRERDAWTLRDSLQQARDVCRNGHVIDAEAKSNTELGLQASRSLVLPTSIEVAEEKSHRSERAGLPK